MKHNKKTNKSIKKPSKDSNRLVTRKYTQMGQQAQGRMLRSLGTREIQTETMPPPLKQLRSNMLTGAGGGGQGAAGTLPPANRNVKQYNHVGNSLAVS